MPQATTPDFKVQHHEHFLNSWIVAVPSELISLSFEIFS